MQLLRGTGLGDGRGERLRLADVNCYHVPDTVRYITVNNMTKYFPFSELSIRDETQTSKQAIAM